MAENKLMNNELIKTIQSKVDQQRLKDTFCPEGSLLRRQQERMLEMLLSFDAICKKHNIPYWLSSGTMLGCIRHGGFIPWDDDLDVEMMRDDYLRFEQVIMDELPDSMALQTHDTDPNYFFFYPKLRDKRSLLEETNNYDKVFKYRGIYIDIFLLEKNPLWTHKLSCNTIGHVYKIMKDPHLNVEAKNNKVARWYDINNKVVYPMLRFISRFSSGRLVRHTFGVPYPKPRHVADLFPLDKALFEGHEFPVPHDWHNYLHRMFGNYEALPNLEELHPHVGKIEFYD